MGLYQRSVQHSLPPSHKEGHHDRKPQLRKSRFQRNRTRQLGWACTRQYGAYMDGDPKDRSAYAQHLAFSH